MTSNVGLLQNFTVFIMIVGSLNWGVAGIRTIANADMSACVMHNNASMVADLLQPIGSPVFSLIIYFAVFASSIIYTLTIVPSLMKCRCLPAVEFVAEA